MKAKKANMIFLGIVVFVVGHFSGVTVGWDNSNILEICQMEIPIKTSLRVNIVVIYLY